MEDPIKFLQRLATEGGSIVSTAELTSAEIATAFNDGRMFVDQDHLGYVIVPNRMNTLCNRVAELETGLKGCAEHLELALSRLGCPTNGNDGGRHGHDADDMGGIRVLEDASDLLRRK